MKCFRKKNIKIGEEEGGIKENKNMADKIFIGKVGGENCKLRHIYPHGIDITDSITAFCGIDGQEYPKCECCPYGKTAEILAADILLKGNASKLQALNGFKTSWLGIIQSVIIKGLKAFFNAPLGGGK